MVRGLLNKLVSRSPENGSTINSAASTSTSSSKSFLWMMNLEFIECVTCEIVLYIIGPLTGVTGGFVTMSTIEELEKAAQMFSGYAGDKTEHLFPAGEPVGVLAATAMSNPAYKAVLDASPNSNSSWELMKISDFGLARWLPSQWTHHSITPIKGTFGHLAPRYYLHGVVDEKTNVFAWTC